MIHFHHPTFRNPCPGAADPAETQSTTPGDVTCPRCRGVALAFARGSEETLRDAPAVKRRDPTPAGGVAS